MKPQTPTCLRLSPTGLYTVVHVGLYTVDSDTYCLGLARTGTYLQFDEVFFMIMGELQRQHCIRNHWFKKLSASVAAPRNVC